MLALSLARAGDVAGLRFHFISGRGGDLENEFRATGKPFLIIPRRMSIDPVFIYRLFRYCRTNHISVIHCHQIPECLNAWIVAKLLACKIFLTYHGYFYFSKNLFVKRAGLFLAGRVNSNIFVSNTLRDYYFEKYLTPETRWETVYNGIFIPPEHDYDTKKLRNTAGFTDDNIVLGMTGNFSPARNHFLICKVFSEIVKKHPSGSRLRLIFVGKKDREPSPLFTGVQDICSKACISEKVYFAGPVINAVKFVRNFDLFVYSTRRETFCLSVAEAISAGVPVIVNDLPVMKEITYNGKYGTLYKTDDEDDLFRVLSESIDNLSLLKRKSESLKAPAYEVFSVAGHIRRLEELYLKE